MGPPLNSGGDPQEPPHDGPRGRGFNGAAAEQRRRHHVVATKVRGRNASMGPPLNSGGDVATRDRDTLKAVQLQWGRR